MVQRLFLDMAPLPRYIDTLQTDVQPLSDSVSDSGASHSLPYILAAIAAALIGLGLLIFMVRSYRRHCEHKLDFENQNS